MSIKRYKIKTRKIKFFPANTLNGVVVGFFYFALNSYMCKINTKIMIQEEKDLLLKDLCARLLYGVKCNVGEEIPYTLCRIGIDDRNGHLLDFIETKGGLDMQVYLSEVKPYLFPMSSMTPKQKAELANLTCETSSIFETAVLEIEFYIKNHIDYRGLIGKGLAIDATGLNIY